MECLYGYPKASMKENIIFEAQQPAYSDLDGEMAELVRNQLLIDNSHLFFKMKQSYVSKTSEMWSTIPQPQPRTDPNVPATRWKLSASKEENGKN